MSNNIRISDSLKKDLSVATLGISYLDFPIYEKDEFILVSNEIRKNIDKYKFCVISNLPKKNYKSSILVFTSIVGIPISYKSEGELFIDVKPIKDHDTEKNPSFRTSGDFDFHTDLSYMDFPPDFLSLYCVQQDKFNQAYNKLAILDDFIETLPNWILEELRTPQFDFKTPSHFNSDYQFLKNVSIISDDYSNGNLIRLRKDNIFAKTPTATSALEILYYFINKNNISFKLESGDLLILNNRKTLHARTAFTPTYDESDRHLVRVFSVKK